MAKDDYNVISYKVLAYLYGIFKRKIAYDQTVFRKLISLDDINEQYFSDVLRNLQTEGYIERLHFTKACGNEYILTSEYSDMFITHKGIQYLSDNSTMKQIKEKLINNVELIGSLIKTIF